jgi:hypothetical protein
MRTFATFREAGILYLKVATPFPFVLADPILELPRKKFTFMLRNLAPAVFERSLEVRIATRPRLVAAGWVKASVV